MLRPEDSLAFQRVTGAIRKPVIRFRLASGRHVELLAIHFEPGWAYTGAVPRPILQEIVSRLYPNETPVVVANLENVSGAAFVCIAYFYSDAPVNGDAAANYSVLLACAPISNIDQNIWTVASGLLSM